MAVAVRGSDCMGLSLIALPMRQVWHRLSMQGRVASHMPKMRACKWGFVGYIYVLWWLLGCAHIQLASLYRLYLGGLLSSQWGGLARDCNVPTACWPVGVHCSWKDSGGFTCGQTFHSLKWQGYHMLRQPESAGVG